MGADVVVGRFLGPNLLVQTLVRAGNFALNPTITGTAGQQIPVYMDSEVAQAIQQNTDIQELALLVGAMTEKAFRDFVANNQIGGAATPATTSTQDSKAAFLCAIGNAKPSAINSTGGVYNNNPPVAINGFEVTPDGLKRIMVLRDIIGFEGIQHALETKKLGHDSEKSLRRFIHNVIVEEMTDRIAAIAGIEDNTLPLHELIEAVVEQPANAFRMTDGWRRDMRGPYLNSWQVVWKNFTTGQRIIADAVNELATVPMRSGALRFETARPSYAIG